MIEEELFHRALEKPTLAEQLAFLDQACAGQPELRQRVERLLRSHRQKDSFLQPGATVDRPTRDASGMVIGPYKLIEPIGEGGMGTVWMAQQTEPIKRLVALKLIKSGMDSKQVIARFEAERQALALMDHPNIAKVLDAGTVGSCQLPVDSEDEPGRKPRTTDNWQQTTSGRPYFVMELVKGVPITKYCDEHRLTPRQRLELFIPVCQAVQHAHQKGIIHRDLKPSNVLVALYDGKPVPKVIDFGVAKAAGQPLTEHTLVTGFGNIVGTLEYMSPEQTEFNQLDIDTRSDIYSLGVLLYELLTGSPPFSRKQLEKAGMLEMLRVIREQEPSKPSTKLSSSEALPTLSANRCTEPKKLTRLIKGELDWIVMKSLEKDRSRRYETANGFAIDIQRYLADEPVEACPPSVGYRLRKFVRRHRATVLTAVAILLILVAGIAGTVYGLIRAERRRAEAERARADEAAQRQLADIQRKKAEQAEAETLADFRASTDDAIAQLIGSKPNLGSQERGYLERTVKRWQAFAARQGDDERSRTIQAEGHFQVAYLWAKLGRRDEARPEYQIAREIRQRLAAEFPANSLHQVNLARTHNNFGILLADLGQPESAHAEYKSALEILEKLVAAYPAEALYQYELSAAHNNLGLLLERKKQREAARKEYELSRAMRRKLVEAYPDHRQYQQDLASSLNNLGILLHRLGERDAARVELEAARDRYKKLAADYPDLPLFQRYLAFTHNNLGSLLMELDQADEARTEFHSACGLYRKLVAAFPGMPDYQHDQAHAHYNLGILLLNLGEFDAAQKESETARDLQQKLVLAFPAMPKYRRALAATHNHMGQVLLKQGDAKAASAEYETARDLYKKLAAEFPGVPDDQRNLAHSHNNLGSLLLQAGKLDLALVEYEAARSLNEALVKAHPSVRPYQVDLGGNYCNLGMVIRDKGKPADSLHWFDLAIRTLAPVYEQDRQESNARQFLCNSHMGKANAYERLKKYAEAVKHWDQTVELCPAAERIAFRGSRAIARIQAGQTAEAISEIDEVTQVDRWSAQQWYGFACAYANASKKISAKEKEYGDRAMEMLRKAVASGYTNGTRMSKDQWLAPLRQREDFQKLLAELSAGKK